MKRANAIDMEISETKQLIETNAKDAPVKDVLWNAQEAKTEEVKIQDPGVGKANILRFFFFKKPFKDHDKFVQQNLISSLHSND